MTNFEKEKNTVSAYLADSDLARNASFWLQRDKILEKYPNSIFPKENQSLEDYIIYLLCYFPFKIPKKIYVEDCLLYLCQQKNHYMVNVTKELYPIIGKQHAKDQKQMERSIRTLLNKDFLNIPLKCRNDIFAITEDVIPSNANFLFNLVNYIKAHYYEAIDLSFTPEQQEYFLSHLKPEDDALSILVNAEMRKKIERFLYEKLGHFRGPASKSQQILVDLLLYYINNNLESLSTKDVYNSHEFRDKWDIHDYEWFPPKMTALAFTIEKAYKLGNIDSQVYREIFGDRECHRAVLQYIIQVGNYLKEQDFVRSLKNGKSI